jgi:hypothetical protein
VHRESLSKAAPDQRDALVQRLYHVAASPHLGAVGCLQGP